MAGQRLCIGVITAPHGVRGLMRVKSFTAHPDDLAAYGPLTDSGGKPLRLKLNGHARGMLLARIDGIDDRDAAERLRGVELYVARDALPDVEDEDEFYYADLIGLQAVRTNGAIYGTVKALHDFGAGDMIEITLEEGGSVVFPFTRQVVPEIDLAQDRVVVDPPTSFGDPEPGHASESPEEPEDAS
jgi:16S rRNA processing protein RimM